VGYAVYWGSGSASYVAFVLGSRDETPVAIALGEVEEIDRLIGEWRHRISTPPEGASAEAVARAAGEKGRHRIWDPLVGHVGQARRIFIVPDGAINTISFGALPDGEDGYLVEGPAVLHYLSSERDLVPPRSAGGGHGLLSVGGPDFD